jgi:hypothetical protein
VKLKGSRLRVIRAGTVYQDPGATAFDLIDGDLSAAVKTTGNTVMSSDSYQSFSSCFQILQSAQRMDEPKLQSGWYHISVEKEPKRLGVGLPWAEASGAGHQYDRFSTLRVWCDMVSRLQVQQIDPDLYNY